MMTIKEIAERINVCPGIAKSYVEEIIGRKKGKFETFDESIVEKCLQLKENRKHNKGGSRGPISEEQKQKIRKWNAIHKEEHRKATKEGMKDLHGYLSEKQKEIAKIRHPEENLRKFWQTHKITDYVIPFRGKSRYYFDGIYYDSSFELIFKLANPDANRCENYITYEFEGNIHKYWPDFVLNGEYYELKGPQFFDENGKMINPFDRTTDDLYEAKHQCMIANNVHIITNVDKEKEIIEQKYCPEFWKLFDTKLPFPYDDVIYKCHKKGQPSPYEAWNNMELRQKAIFNRLKYGRFAEYHTVDRIMPVDIVTAFSVMHIATKVSEFSKRRATNLAESYLKDCKTIADPFAGFGGRYEGLHEHWEYHGFDIEPKFENCIERDILSMKEIEEYDALFTCPPYSDKEEWLKPMDVIKDCDGWIDECLKHFNCKKYLFVVDNTEKYKDFIVEEIRNNSSTKTNGAKEYVLLIYFTDTN